MCATYGAGVSAACVVDVGEEKTSLCCVEDGMSNANTRWRERERERERERATHSFTDMLS